MNALVRHRFERAELIERASSLLVLSKKYRQCEPRRIRLRLNGLNCSCRVVAISTPSEVNHIRQERRIAQRGEAQFSESFIRLTQTQPQIAELPMRLRITRRQLDGLSQSF